MNIDSMNTEELVDFQTEHKDNPDMAALVNYAGLKYDAIFYRATGKIQKAMDIETHCDEIYKQLPRWQKW